MSRAQATKPQGFEVPTVGSLAEAAQVVQKGPTRVVNWFDVPEPLAVKIGVSKVGLVELTAGEELMATKRASGNQVQMAYELAKEAWRFVDDMPINTGDLSADAVWNSTKSGMSALRQLVLGAYGMIHNPTPDVAAAFLASRRQVVSS